MARSPKTCSFDRCYYGLTHKPEGALCYIAARGPEPFGGWVCSDRRAHQAMLDAERARRRPIDQERRHVMIVTILRRDP